jgi:hydrogenase maturation protease
VSAVLLRRWERLTAQTEISAERINDDLARITVRVSNTSDLQVNDDNDARATAVRHALVSTHLVLTVADGRWLSLADPPEDARDAAATCSNVGLWPVLVGEPGDDLTILASPIILEDHPRVAPESAGELFDSTEIDEILSLRILALTDAEKEEMRSADPRTREMLERTESLSDDAMLRLHGAIRELRPTRGQSP